jgi:hypothetical protein
MGVSGPGRVGAVRWVMGDGGFSSPMRVILALDQHLG